MQPHDAVVYDLDGTLVRLPVDWGAVERALADCAVDAGIDPEGHTAWELLDAGEAAGVGDEMEALIAEHERAGARESTRLPHADRIPEDRPVGVCSLNCEAACRTALDRNDLAGHVEAVVGRDTVPERKPDPAPLAAALAPLGVAPGDALFVGDSPADAEAAEAAGLAFRWVEGAGPADD